MARGYKGAPPSPLKERHFAYCRGNWPDGWVPKQSFPGTSMYFKKWKSLVPKYPITFAIKKRAGIYKKSLVFNICLLDRAIRIHIQ